MPKPSYGWLLKRPGILFYLTTEFLGVLNDNIFRMILILFAKNIKTSIGIFGISSYVSLVGIVFILPFLLFSGFGGYLSDAYNKKRVLILTKSLEVISMFMAVWSLPSGNLLYMLPILFLMATQSSLFGPAKYSIIPELVGETYLTRLNGLVEMTTVIGIVLGTVIGAVLYAAWAEDLRVAGYYMLIIAIVGWGSSFFIARVDSICVAKKLSLNPWREIWEGVQKLRKASSLMGVVLGILFFWFLGSFVQALLVVYGTEVLQVSDFLVGLLNAYIAAGIGIGALVAGRVSHGHSDLGLVPIAMFGMGIFLWSLSSTSLYVTACCFLVPLGFFGGLYIVPLNAYLQKNAPIDSRGQLIATSNFLSFFGIFGSFVLLPLLHDWLHFTAVRIFFVLSLVTFGAAIWVKFQLPKVCFRFFFWVLTHTLYRIKIVGNQHVPSEGPALIVCNHLSYVDGFLIGASLDRHVHFMLWEKFYHIPWLNWFFQCMRVIPVYSGRKVVKTVEMARRMLEEGHVVCVFPEGAITRTGNILPFKKGITRLVSGLDCPVIPAHLDRVWGSIFSFSQGCFFLKRPTFSSIPVTVSFGEPMVRKEDATYMRARVMELGYEAVRYRQKQKEGILPRLYFRVAKKRWANFCMADSLGKKVTYGQSLIASLLLTRLLDPLLKLEPIIGLALPSSVGAALANVSLSILGKVVVNLNFTVGQEAFESTIKQCDIKTIITSRVFLERISLNLENTQVIYLEDLIQQIKPSDKILMALFVRLTPYKLLWRLYGDSSLSSRDLATLMFSSGSTGLPKGIMLSHHAIIANIQSSLQVLPHTMKERIMGVLPFFHSFGYTATLWLPLLSGKSVVYHPNHMDAKTIGQLIKKYQVAIMVSAPTFYQLYLRQCDKEDFASLKYAVVGSEKLRTQLAVDFKKKFGKELYEGYGCTELGPVVSVNRPNVENGVSQIGMKENSVGQTLPGVLAKVIDIETKKELPIGSQGLLCIKSPSMMLGYWKQPCDKFLEDDWYNTGDIARLDEDSFIYIIDRVDRFSKIGAEMVPHIRIEEEISSVIGSQDCLIISVVDDLKGERMVVLYVHPELTPETLYQALRDTGLPNLWLPKQSAIFRVEEIPLLPNGKRNYLKAKEIAISKLSPGRNVKQ